MKVFISWAGERSHAVAKALHLFLEEVLPGVTPWLSSADIDKGARWGAELAHQLDEATFGIICLTRENLGRPWILFEAGAMSKTLTNRVCPYLFQLSFADVTGPLAQFQGAMGANQNDTQSLVLSLNKAMGERGRPEEKVRRTFDKWWPDLRKSLDAIPAPSEAPPPRRAADEMIEEILQLVRRQAKAPLAPEERRHQPKRSRLPRATAAQVQLALEVFDKDLRGTERWLNWESKGRAKFAIEHGGKRYPVKRIVSMATGADVHTFSGGTQANEYISNLGFKVIEVRN